MPMDKCNAGSYSHSRHKKAENLLTFKAAGEHAANKGQSMHLYLKVRGDVKQ